MDLQLLRDFGVALFIGVLVGIDREQRKRDQDYGGVGGVRTFILLAMAGALSAWLAVRAQAPVVFVAGGGFVLAILLAGYWWHARGMTSTPGVTTLVAGFLVYLLGGTVVYGAPALAVALAIVTSAVLAYKGALHGWVGKIGREDFYAALKLLAASFIVLPVIPNHPVDPWGALNPYKIWLLVVMISGLSLVGYVVSRVLGPEKGTPLTGLAGGLVSSTAVTLEFARRSRDEARSGGAMNALAAGLLLAWAVMFVRVIVEVAVVHAPLLGAVAPGMVILGIAATLTAGFWWRQMSLTARSASAEKLPLKNPFNLTSAIKFALLFAVVLLVVKYLQLHYSGKAFYLVAALAGLTDVDAITLSMAEFARKGGDMGVAANSVLIAAVANTICKAGIVAVMGAVGLRRKIAVSTAVLLAAAALVWALVPAM